MKTDEINSTNEKESAVNTACHSPYFDNMMKISRRYSCGIISAHQNEFPEKFKEKIDEFWENRKYKSKEKLRKSAEFINKKAQQITRKNETANKNFTDALLDQIRLRFFKCYKMVGVWDAKKEISFWIWDNDAPFGHDEKLLEELKEFSRLFRQESFVYIPYKSPAKLYEKITDRTDNTETKWGVSDIDYITNIKNLEELLMTLKVRRYSNIEEKDWMAKNNFLKAIGIRIPLLRNVIVANLSEEYSIRRIHGPWTEYRLSGFAGGMLAAIIKNRAVALDCLSDISNKRIITAHQYSKEFNRLKRSINHAPRYNKVSRLRKTAIEIKYPKKGTA